MRHTRINHRPFDFAIFALLSFGLILSPIAASDRLQAQSVLSGDLLFTTGQLNANGIPGSRNILARLDRRTGQAIAWYSDPSAVYLKAVSWSPQGDLLAFVRAEFDGKRYPAQLCLLNRSGARQRCFTDTPVGYSSVYNDYLVTWSGDGKRLYFASGDDKTRRLIEAEVSTGRTLRVLYEYDLQDNELENPPVLAWTNDLSYLTLGAGDNTRVQQGLPVFMVDLKTQQRIDLVHIRGASGSSLFVVCPYFSPQGMYLTAYNFDVPETPAIPQFLILDKQVNILSIVKPSAPFNASPQGCPAWQKDENAFYFDVAQATEQASTLSIVKYTLQSRQFMWYFQSGALNDLAEATVNSHLSLSPDEAFLAFVSPFDPGVKLGTQVTIISATGGLQRYRLPFRFSSDPIWIPQNGTTF